jgi:hypothetical protein
MYNQSETLLAGIVTEWVDQTPTRSKGKPKATPRSVAKSTVKASAAISSPTLTPSPLTPTPSTTIHVPISTIVVPAQTTAQKGMLATLIRNDVSLDRKAEEICVSISFLETMANTCHAQLLALIKDNEHLTSTRLTQEEEERTKLGGTVSWVLAAVNKTRVGLNSVSTEVMDMRGAAKEMRDAARISQRLEAFNTELVALKAMGDASPTHPLPVKPYHTTTNPPAYQDRPPPLVRGASNYCGREFGARGNGYQNKRPAPADSVLSSKRARNDAPHKLYNPSMCHVASTSSAPSPTACSFIMIGPCDNTDDPNSVFSSVLNLLPDTSFFASDYFSIALEGSYFRVGFKGVESARALVYLWVATDPLQGSPYELEVRLPVAKDTALHTHFGSKN